jgi:hypothetical protein
MTRARELAELAAAYDSGGGFGFRNRIINPAMVIDQRNAGASVAVTTSDPYIVDRWVCLAAANSRYTAQQNQGGLTGTNLPAGFTNYLGTTSVSTGTPGATDVYAINQYIEGFNIADLGWGTANAQTVTLSFWVRSSLTGAFGGTINNSGSPSYRSYPFSFTISAANTWEQKTVTIPGDTSGTWATNNGVGIRIRFSLGMGSSFLGTAGAWAAGFVGAPTGSTNVVSTNGATFYITGVQLEAGSVATPFERRDYGRELAMCQRYYEVGLDRNALMWSGSTSTLNGDYYGNKGFCVTKRATPTITTSNQVINGFSSGTPSLTIDTTGVQGSRTSNAVATTSAYWFYNWTASAEL